MGKWPALDRLQGVEHTHDNQKNIFLTSYIDSSLFIGGIRLMKLMQFTLPLLASLACATASAAPIDQSVAKARLSQVLTCERAVTPVEFEALVKAAHGKAIVQASDLSDGEYTVPEPLDVFGRPITQLAQHPGANGEGDFNEYRGFFSGESVQTVAKLGNVPQNEVGQYRKAVGNHDLTVGAEGGSAYIVCSNDVRTVAKTIKRTAREAADAVKRAVQ